MGIRQEHNETAKTLNLPHPSPLPPGEGARFFLDQLIAHPTTHRRGTTRGDD